MDTILAALETESIFILREVFGLSKNPVVLFTSGKDSSVLAHLAKKAFAPYPIPFLFLNIDTGWKFREMVSHMQKLREIYGFELKKHINQDALQKGINPFDHGSEVHTHEYKTVGLKQVLDQHKFDFIIGGARRDEEKSRSKERVFSIREHNHSWTPESQRPEPWTLYNANLDVGQSLRVFPLSNWTEIDIWRYIQIENIPVSSLYLAQKRPTIELNKNLFVVDDDRMRIPKGVSIVERQVRLRTLGCYPLSSAMLSEANSLDKIILELQSSKNSERSGRLIDYDSVGSMEFKKRSGYF